MTKVQDLALKCLRDKWFYIDSHSDHDEWIEDCAFCEEAKEKAEEDDWSQSLRMCHYCFISEDPICKAIEELQDDGDPSLIVEALEEIAKFGDLSSETAERLSEHV